MVDDRSGCCAQGDVVVAGVLHSGHGLQIRGAGCLACIDGRADGCGLGRLRGLHGCDLEVGCGEAGAGLRIGVVGEESHLSLLGYAVVVRVPAGSLPAAISLVSTAAAMTSS